MHCYVCVTEDRMEPSPAVAICQGCNAALCVEHAREAGAHAPGGVRLSCPHDPWRPAARV